MSKIPRIGAQGFASHDRTRAPEGRWNVATGATPWSALDDRTQAPEGRQKLMAAIRRPSGASVFAPVSFHGLTPVANCLCPFRGLCVCAVLIPVARAQHATPQFRSNGALVLLRTSDDGLRWVAWANLFARAHPIADTGKL